MAFLEKIQMQCGSKPLHQDWEIVKSNKSQVHPMAPQSSWPFCVLSEDWTRCMAILISCDDRPFLGGCVWLLNRLVWSTETGSTKKCLRGATESEHGICARSNSRNPWASPLNSRPALACPFWPLGSLPNAQRPSHAESSRQYSMVMQLQSKSQVDKCTTYRSSWSFLMLRLFWPSLSSPSSLCPRSSH